MIQIPDYYVLDFLDWIYATHPRYKQAPYALLDREVAVTLANEYLESKDWDGQWLNRRKIKKYIKDQIGRLVDGKEFDSRLKDCCTGQRFESIEYSLCQFEWLMSERGFSELRRNIDLDPRDLDPYSLADSLIHILEKQKVERFQPCFKLMVRTPRRYIDYSAFIDFLEWMKKNNKKIDQTKIPRIVFGDLIREYESSEGIKLDKDEKEDIWKCLTMKTPKQITEWIRIVLGNEKARELSNVFDRYYNDKANYKCILLPLKGESHFRKFVKDYWYDLDEASSEWLDIFYSISELERSGFESLNKIRNLEVDTNMLPCIVIWRSDISQRSVIEVRGLDNSDLFKVISEIIMRIKHNIVLDQICEEVNLIVEEIRESKREINKIVQNINGNNYGAITAVNNGSITNTVNIHNVIPEADVELAKTELNKIVDLTSVQKEFLFNLLDEARTSASSNDSDLQKNNQTKFRSFMLGLGKVADKVLSVLGSIASIAGFFGIQHPLM